MFAAGNYPKNSPVKNRGDSGLNDGNQAKTNLIGGYYDSGNNIEKLKNECESYV
jgi:hypothetical protein